MGAAGVASQPPPETTKSHSVQEEPYITLEPRIGGFFVLFNRPEHIAHQYVEKHLTLKKFEDFLPRPHFTISMIYCQKTEQFASKRKLIATDLRPCMFQVHGK